MSRAERRQRIQALRAEARDLASRLERGDGSDEDLTRVDELADEIGRLEAEQRDEDESRDRETRDREQRETQAREARERLRALVGGGSGHDDDRRERVNDDERRVPARTEQRVERIGTQFSRSAQFTSFRERNFVGQVAVEFPDLDARALVTTGTRPNPQQPVGSIEPASRALRIADLIDRQTTTANSVPYIQETSTAPGAAAEVAEGAQKPEAGFTFQELDSPVRTIAHWVPVTRQAAEDDSTLQGYIEGRLGYGLEYRLDGQILAGDGVAPNLRGILNTSGIGTYTPAAAEARIITLRKAITVAQLAEYAPDTAVLHPQEWQAIELDTDGNGAFRVAPNVADALTPRVWGLNVVVTTGIAAGRYLVGAMRLGATLWERQGVRILMSDSHGTNFTANILVLLAEMRAALTVWRPAAFVSGTFV